MTSFNNLICSKPALYVFQGALALGSVALETVSYLAVDKAIASAYEFGQYCNLQGSTTTIPQLSNITCQALERTDYYAYALQTIFGTSAVIAAGTLGATFILKNSSSSDPETTTLLNQKENRLPFYTGALTVAVGAASYIANRIFSSGAHRAAQIAGQCCSVANTTNPSCAGIICESVQNSEAFNFTGRVVTTIFLCVSATGYVASTVFCKCKKNPYFQESDIE